MSQISTTARERIQAQGFCGLSDAAYAQINYPLRLSLRQNIRTSEPICR
jgi:hypothetical protein